MSELILMAQRPLFTLSHPALWEILVFLLAALAGLIFAIFWAINCWRFAVPLSSKPYIREHRWLSIGMVTGLIVATYLLIGVISYAIVVSGFAELVRAAIRLPPSGPRAAFPNEFYYEAYALFVDATLLGTFIGYLRFVIRLCRPSST